MEPPTSSCCKSESGPGYATPLDAFQSGQSEKLLYIPCIVPSKDRPDYLATVDVDSSSETYFKVISRTHVPYMGDELHHTGWNACSSCHANPHKRRNRLVVLGFDSSRIYVIDVERDPRKPTIHKIIAPEELFGVGSSTPHTTHCLPSGEVMISCIGDGPDLNGKGTFVLIDGTNWKVSGTYAKREQDVPPFGYDFWYQPYHNVMISTEWGHVWCLKNGFDQEDVRKGNYGTHINVFDWKEKKLIQRIDLGPEGVMPMEIRFLHDPKASEGFVAAALYGNIYRFYKTEKGGDWAAEKVINVPTKTVEGWAMPEMPAGITDIIISMDDKYLYLSNWIHGDIRQYNIQETKKPRLTGQLFLGGSITKEFGVKVIKDDELESQPLARFINGRRIQGGPQMLQLSLDGCRLYVTTSLYSAWDKQFYPELSDCGSVLMQIDVDHDKGGMTLNQQNFVDFGLEPDGPVMAHEIRYPGGDCTSDIYLPK